jgi:hypothetical protein
MVPTGVNNSRQETQVHMRYRRRLLISVTLLLTCIHKHSQAIIYVDNIDILIIPYYTYEIEI